MKQPSKAVIGSRNQAVQNVYHAMLKLAKQLLSTLDREELRYCLIREEKTILDHGIIHEFVNPLLFLRLDSYKDGTLGIHYGFESCRDYEHITSVFCRTLYKLSGKDIVSPNIENSIRTDWYIHNPDEMFQYIEDRNKYHKLIILNHKPAVTRRKQMKAVA